MDLYLVAVLPPEPVLGQVWALKQEVHARTGSRNAIRLPPHITLIPPTRQPPGFEAAARAALQEFAATRTTFTVGLQDFAWFGNRTLFVQVVQEAALRELHAALLQWCARQLPAIQPEKRPFTPHMTLATRDLPSPLVPALQQEFAQRHYTASFMVSALCLFRHNGQQWESIQDFFLNDN
jgi:2'-5' RNA ligase